MKIEKTFRNFVLNLKRLNSTWTIGRMVRFIQVFIIRTIRLQVTPVQGLDQLFLVEMMPLNYQANYLSIECGHAFKQYMFVRLFSTRKRIDTQYIQN